MQLLPWSAYWPDMSPSELVWNLIGRHLARDPCPLVSKDEFWLRMQIIWNSLPQTDLENLFDAMSHRIAILIAVRSFYTKYWFRTLNFPFFCFEDFVIHLHQYTSYYSDDIFLVMITSFLQTAIYILKINFDPMNNLI